MFWWRALFWKVHLRRSVVVMITSQKKHPTMRTAGLLMSCVWIQCWSTCNGPFGGKMFFFHKRGQWVSGRWRYHENSRDFLGTMIDIEACQDLATVGRQSIYFYERNRANLHYPLVQCLGRAQDIQYCFPGGAIYRHNTVLLCTIQYNSPLKSTNSLGGEDFFWLYRPDTEWQSNFRCSS